MICHVYNFLLIILIKLLSIKKCKFINNNLKEDDLSKIYTKSSFFEFIMKYLGILKNIKLELLDVLNINKLTFLELIEVYKNYIKYLAEKT